jgi:hypothetical protein
MDRNIKQHFDDTFDMIGKAQQVFSDWDKQHAQRNQQQPVQQDDPEPAPQAYYCGQCGCFRDRRYPCSHTALR